MPASIPPRPTPAVQRAIATHTVTFDAGQTLIELDLDFLARRLGERGLEVAPGALAAAEGPAWRRHDELVAGGANHPWKALMTALLVGAGVEAHRLDQEGVVEWLWSEQPRVNLFRKPIPGMVALARELAAAGVRVAVLSNSEGRLAELLAEIGIADPFAVIVDSGRLAFGKPDPRIFQHTLDALGVTGLDVIHIGDSWAADVVGALASGWRAVWYGRGATEVDDPRVARARDPGEARAALVGWGVLSS